MKEKYSQNPLLFGKSNLGKRDIAGALRRLALLAALLPLFMQAIEIQEITGPWHGILEIGQQRLPLVINIGADGAATLDSPAQSAKGIPAEYTLSGDTLSVAATSIGLKYTGAIGGEGIDGTLSQSGMRFPLALKRGEYVPVRPQTPQPPYAYETKDVQFVNPADSMALHGTLSFPLMYDLPVMRDVPVVVLVTGSGMQNRDEEVFGHKPFAVIADFLARCGIASLRYDDRGYGDPEYDGSHATTLTFAGDAAAAVDYARSAVEKSGRVGVLGHSEGGQIALMLAADGKADFAVTLAAPTVRGDSLMVMQNRKLLSLAPQISVAQANAYAQALERLFAFMIANPDAKEWPGIDQETAVEESLRANLGAIISTRSAWLNWFIAYDPTEAICSIQVPVFALNGSLDMQVDSQQNLGALGRKLPVIGKTVIKEYPGLNHLFQHATTGSVAEYQMIEETISGEVLSDIAKWIKEK